MTQPTEARTKHPRIGVGVVVWHEGYVLLGKRKGAHGAGELALPGGKVEPNESPLETAETELMQETGLEGSGQFVKLKYWSWDCYEEIDRDYLTVYYAVRWNHQNPRVMEPDKCEWWDWYLWRNLWQTYEGQAMFAGLKELHEFDPELGQGP